MKIKYALTSCDSNPTYYEFWPLVSKVWKEYLNIEPILIFVGEEIPKELNKKYGEIIKFKPIKDIPTSTQSQFIRLWYAKNFDDTIITTDIDMFPLSKWYFKDQIKNVEENKFLMLAVKPDWYNICYNVGNGKIFEEVLELKETFEETLRPYYQSIKNEDVWFLDELYLTEKVKKNNENVIRIFRNSLNRIDRGFWNYNPSLVKLGHYYDCHSLRPYKTHKNQIDQLLNLL